MILKVIIKLIILQFKSMTDLDLGDENRVSNNHSDIDNLKNTDSQELLKAALSFHQSGNTIKAEEYYKALIERGFRHPSIFINYGILCQRTSRLLKAIELYKNNIDLYPDIPESYLNIGSILRKQGKLKEAEKYTYKVIEMNPNNFSANLNLGNILLDQTGVISYQVVSFTVKCQINVLI